MQFDLKSTNKDEEHKYNRKQFNENNLSISKKTTLVVRRDTKRKKNMKIVICEKNVKMDEDGRNN